MDNVLKSVKEWCDLTEIPVPDEPQLLDKKRAILRANLMEEENLEYLQACEGEDLVGVADALGDMLYILTGTMLEHGMQDVIEKVFNEIHRSNLSKMGEDGKPIRRVDGKILKGPNYTPPEIKRMVLKLPKQDWH